MTAAEELVELLHDLERRRTSVMDLVLEGRSPEEWTIYPNESGIFDRRTRSQFYYHVHPGADHEAGHFHTVRLFPGRTAHIVGISMAPSGWPQNLFTVNLWAIGDAHETPENLKRYARRFRLDERAGDPRLVRFVNLMFRVYLHEIEALHDEKEKTLIAYRRTHPDQDPFEDRSLEVLSQVAIDPRELLSRERGDRSPAGAAARPRSSSPC